MTGGEGDRDEMTSRETAKDESTGGRLLGNERKVEKLLGMR
jgi:hypothetical protein